MADLGGQHKEALNLAPSSGPTKAGPKTAPKTSPQLGQQAPPQALQVGLCDGALTLAMSRSSFVANRCFRLYLGGNW